MTSVQAPTSICVKRAKGGWRDRARAYRIEVDRAEVGRLRRGQELTIQVSPGEHHVRAKIDWTGSEEISVAVAAGASASIVVWPKGGSAWRGVRATFSGASWVNIAVE